MSDSEPPVGPVDPEQATGRQVVRGVLRRNRRRLVAASLFIMGHQACEALVPVVIGLAIDTAIGAGSPWLFAATLAGLAALFTTLTLCWRWAARHGYGAAMDEAHRLRSSLADRFVRGGGAGRARGELLSIATSDADLSSKAITYVSGLWGAAAALGVSCAVLLTIDVRLGVLLIVVSVAATLAMNVLSPWLTRRATVQQETLAATGALATDLLGGLRVLHGLGAQQQASSRYRSVSQAAVHAGTAAGRARAVQLGATALAGTAVMAVSVVAAGLLALEGSISIGAFVAAVGAAQFIAEPLGNVGFYLQLRASVRAGAGRVAAFTTAPAATSALATSAASTPNSAATSLPGSPPEPVTARAMAPALRVGVRDAAAPILQVQAGEYVGVVADAASTALLLAALDPGPEASADGWQAHADGVALTALDDEARRATIHLEPRRPELFAGTVADNLALAGPAAAPAPAPDPAPDPAPGPPDGPGTREGALHAAHAHDFVAALPGGLDAPLRERGSSLSGGQRQRLVLARALLTDPPVLVLNHPTSAVDSLTEDAVAAGVRAFRHGPAAGHSTVVLTSSPALLAGTDRVVLLHDGAVLANGLHAELLTTHAAYRAEVLR